MQGNDLLPAGGRAAESGGNAKIVYVLYLGAIVIGLLALIGVIVAYVSRNDATAGSMTTTGSRAGPSGSGCCIRRSAPYRRSSWSAG